MSNLLGLQDGWQYEKFKFTWPEIGQIVLIIAVVVFIILSLTGVIQPNRPID